MKTPKVVIGAGYGDEGKGLITDYLCAKHGADVVIRFNGGAQAGHTVQTPAGERHVFSHFGSGMYAGAATFLSKFFIVNPIAFFKEVELLYSPLRATVPDLFIDPYAMVSTPYDMIINQMLEQERGNGRVGAKKHGSCGLGIGETVERCENLAHDAGILWHEVEDFPMFEAKMKYVRDVWYPTRCAQLGLDPDLGAHVAKNDNIFNNFIEDTKLMATYVKVMDSDYLDGANQIVFEGAQGLMLDQDYGIAPHITRSNTGILNVLDICGDVGIQELDVTYVTRCYTTRHGAGPLDHELIVPPYRSIVDQTNVPNSFQGSLRFANLDLNVIKNAIDNDLYRGSIYLPPPYMKVNAGLAVTCLDQLNGEDAKFYSGGSLVKVKSDAYGDAADYINNFVGLKSPVIKSYGPTRADVIQKEIV